MLEGRERERERGKVTAEKPVKAVSRAINTDLRQSCRRVEVIVYSLTLIYFIDRNLNIEAAA